MCMHYTSDVMCRKSILTCGHPSGCWASCAQALGTSIPILIFAPIALRKLAPVFISNSLKTFTVDTTVAEMKQTLRVIWDNLSHAPIDKSVKNFTNQINACVEAGGGYFENTYSKIAKMFIMLLERRLFLRFSSNILWTWEMTTSSLKWQALKYGQYRTVNIDPL